MLSRNGRARKNEKNSRKTARGASSKSKEKSRISNAGRGVVQKKRGPLDESLSFLVERPLTVRAQSRKKKAGLVKRLLDGEERHVGLDGVGADMNLEIAGL